MTLTHPPSEVLPVNEDRLNDLAVIVNHNQAEVEKSLASALHHVILAGAALNEACSLLAPGTFKRWCEDNVSVSYTTVRTYRYIATHKELLPPEYVTPELVNGAHTKGTVMRSLRYLRAIGAPPVRIGRPPVVDEDEVKRLRQSGLSQREIASLFGVSRTAVQNALMTRQERKVWRNQKERRRRERDRAYRRELEQQSIAATKDDLSEAYSLVRKSLQRLQAARGQAVTKEGKRDIGSAIAKLHMAEDFIVRASKASV